MVTNITSLTGNGLKDWLIQRITSVFFAIYVLFIVSFLLTHPQLNFADWSALFHHVGFKVASFIALFALSLHAWIGIWTVTTDYVKNTATRLTIQMLVVLWLLGQLVWGLMILWGQ
ncbi:succinate dehydrogenase, hydrophobic membrane anchor protein [Legionella jordanis]|uniref:Succinate dehydrogenase hydrophobic membrane anchor subunit n=1 Tax=Legionella jordanis TaxID=456 RepID=A0A0W0VDE3_9GAMM|nr:succinate dehydrogenase, hydrophobic membrane anchor protein [Legionella jordanis]KTD18172.1 succinate dehydrogenase, hydrophobic membrane anchor protein [Legionella jordanis]RMX01134.1 succinate dehydrogenase, hydrophobic membrane anchor protein [Legionella jordanis]RMX21364.1 succinate dehydrogenase, hydrophobic membrane anchor protein [Legionella jordanis]VEH13735.1 succinate dehydrogenase, hydrophobic membrane anchor protein [Legionella jordanis]HAT8714554.1 succinate dehydrogenase, hyd